MHSGCVWVKLVVLKESRCNPDKVVVFGQKWLCSSKVDAFGKK